MHTHARLAAHHAPRFPPSSLVVPSRRRRPPRAMHLTTTATTGSFSYHRLKKLPLAPDDAAVAVVRRTRIAWRPFAAAAAAGGGGGRRRRPRLRISGLARALRRKAAAVGGRVRAAAAKVAARLREGRPYVGDLFAGNYMFMQVTPSPTMAGLDRGFLPYHHAGSAIAMSKSKPGSFSYLHPASGVLYKV